MAGHDGGRKSARGPLKYWGGVRFSLLFLCRVPCRPLPATATALSSAVTAHVCTPNPPARSTRDNEIKKRFFQREGAVTSCVERA